MKKQHSTKLNSESSLPETFNLDTMPLANFSYMFSDLEGHYRCLVETIDDIVYTLDESGHFTFVNNSVQRLGYKPIELIGKHFSVIVHPDDFHLVNRSDVLPNFKGKVTGTLNAPKLFDERRSYPRKTMGLGLRLVPKKNVQPSTSAEVLFCEVNASGQYERNSSGENKRFLGTLGLIRSVSPCTDSKIQTAKTNSTLETAVIRTIINCLVHEFNNIFTGIVGNLQLFEARTTNSGETTTRTLEGIKTASARALEILQQLSMYTRSDRLIPKKVCVEKLLLTEVEKLSSEYSSEICCQIAPQLWTCNVNPEVIAAVIRIVFVYMLQSTIEGGKVKVVVKNVAKPYHTNIATPNCGYISISFESEEHDILSETCETLYEPFERPDILKGGLALILSYMLVRENSGFITVKSNSANTKAIAIYLPAASQGNQSFCA